jgi:hypothetical protein
MRSREFHLGAERADSSRRKSMRRGIIATAVKGAFKMYLVPATRTRSAVASVTGGWHDLVAQARQEHEARKQADVHGEPQPHAEPAVTAAAVTAPTEEPKEQPGSTARRPSTPRGASKPRATGTRRDHLADRPTSVIETPPMPASAQPEGELAASASPTLIEAGESRVEVRPNPAISPVHVTSGVIAHVPPEVRHRLAGNGPIRA